MNRKVCTDLFRFTENINNFIVKVTEQNKEKEEEVDEHFTIIKSLKIIMKVFSYLHHCNATPLLISAWMSFDKALLVIRFVKLFVFSTLDIINVSFGVCCG